jgi:hypothetical protein
MSLSLIHLVTGKSEISRRRALIPRGQVAEIWADHGTPDAFWVGAESKMLLDAAGDPLDSALTLVSESIRIYYGPALRDVESLPREESLRARVLSAGGIAVAWITLDRFGERVSYEPQSPDDPIFHLRRVGGGAAHVWRLFRTRTEAIEYLSNAYGSESEAVDWAKALAVGDFAELLRRAA